MNGSRPPANDARFNPNAPSPVSAPAGVGQPTSALPGPPPAALPLPGGPGGPGRGGLPAHSALSRPTLPGPPPVALPHAGPAGPAFFPPAANGLGGVPPAPPGADYPFATTGLPHLSYMEGQLATQAVLVEQQRRIKHLELQLYATQAELSRVVASASAAAASASERTDAMDSEAKKPSSRYWTPEEHKRFLEGLELYGPREIKSISRHVGTRSATQVRTHAQKYWLRVERERVKEEAGLGLAGGGAVPPGAVHAPQVATSAPPTAAPPRVSPRNRTRQPAPSPKREPTTAPQPRAKSSPPKARRGPASPRAGRARARPRTKQEPAGLLRLARDLPNGRTAAQEPAGENANGKRAGGASGGSSARRAKAARGAEQPPTAAGGAAASAGLPSGAPSAAAGEASTSPSGAPAGGPAAAPADDANAAPSASRPPLRREPSSSALAGATLARPLSRSNSFLGAGRPGFQRTNSILSLLSGFPTTGLHGSSSTERLLGLDGDDPLKRAEPVGSGGLPAVGSSAALATGAGAALPAAGAVVAAGRGLGDRGLSFGQLDGMDFDDAGAVVVAMEGHKWGGGEA